MTDFHRSLDRALDPHNDWGVEPTLLARMIDHIDNRMVVDLKHVEALAAGFTRLPLPVGDIKPLAEMVERDIRSLVRMTMNEPIGYDGFGAPLYLHQIPSEGTE